MDFIQKENVERIFIAKLNVITIYVRVRLSELRQPCTISARFKNVSIVLGASHHIIVIFPELRLIPFKRSLTKLLSFLKVPLLIINTRDTHHGADRVRMDRPQQQYIFKVMQTRIY